MSPERREHKEGSGRLPFLRMNSERWKKFLVISLPLTTATLGIGIGIWNGLAGNMEYGLMSVIAGLGAGYYALRSLTSTSN